MTNTGAIIASDLFASLEDDREAALPLLEEARQRFVALGFPQWIESVESLLAQAQGQVLTLEMIAGMVRAARDGDQEAGRQAWQIGAELQQTPDGGYRALGRAIQALLTGEAPEVALRALSADLRARIEELLHDQD